MTDFLPDPTEPTEPAATDETDTDPTVTPNGDTLPESDEPEDTTPPVAPEAEPVVETPEETTDEVVNTVTPPANPDVVPARSETPTPSSGNAMETGVLIPRDGSFGDSREIAAAEALGLPTPTGTPLNASSAEVIRELERAFQGFESWISWGRKQLSKIQKV